MQSIAYRQGFSWIGPYTGLWMWSDGTNISSPQWLSGQPDYSYKNTDCAVLGNGMFSDTDCSTLNYFICHISEWFVSCVLKNHNQSNSFLSCNHLSLFLGVFVSVYMCSTADPVRERQIMKLRVKSDGSIFDSDVQSSILELVSHTKSAQSEICKVEHLDLDTPCSFGCSR